MWSWSNGVAASIASASSPQPARTRSSIAATNPASASVEPSSSTWACKRFEHAVQLLGSGLAEVREAERDRLPRAHRRDRRLPRRDVDVRRQASARP